MWGQNKKPYRFGSRKQSCGDNVYFKAGNGAAWTQRDSFHSQPDGSPNPKHIARDTRVDRVLISDDYVYFGGSGPCFPNDLRDSRGRNVCKSGIGCSCFDDIELVGRFVQWIRSFGVQGYQDAPFEWGTLR
ncbi:MAG TPA: hypothetical protein VJ576_01305 [Rhodocyclaceae bacterium]|nr:hypothetical protein [Rhodocyclaceae bacterium]